MKQFSRVHSRAFCFFSVIVLMRGIVLVTLLYLHQQYVPLETD